MTVEIWWCRRARLTSRRFEVRCGGAVFKCAATQDEAQAIARSLKPSKPTPGHATA